MLNSIPLNEIFYCRDRYKTKLRAIKEDENTIFVFLRKSRIYGHRYSTEEFLSNFTPLISSISEDERWHKRIKRAIKCLEASGLWINKLEYLKKLSLMTWEDKKKIEEEYWNETRPIDFTTEKWERWFKKYPFLKCEDANGNISIETKYFWDGSDIKLESMYFGKVRNKEIKEEIKRSIEESIKYTTPYIRTNYDISFEYNPEVKKAWYSKEYKDCGNGYYYIALDHNTAWFIEKD